MFFCAHKHSNHFIKLRVNNWGHMDYLNYIVFTTFLRLESNSCINCEMEGQKCLRFHKKYLHVFHRFHSFTGLEQHDGE